MGLFLAVIDLAGGPLPSPRAARLPMASACVRCRTGQAPSCVARSAKSAAETSTAASGIESGRRAGFSPNSSGLVTKAVRSPTLFAAPQIRQVSRDHHEVGRRQIQQVSG